jgi:hypothetical protein
VLLIGKASNRRLEKKRKLGLGGCQAMLNAGQCLLDTAVSTAVMRPVPTVDGKRWAEDRGVVSGYGGCGF